MCQTAVGQSSLERAWTQFQFFCNHRKSGVAVRQLLFYNSADFADWRKRPVHGGYMLPKNMYWLLQQLLWPVEGNTCLSAPQCMAGFWREKAIYGILGAVSSGR